MATGNEHEFIELKKRKKSGWIDEVMMKMEANSKHNKKVFEDIEN